MVSRSKAIWILGVLILAFGVLSLSRCERPFLDYLDEYEVIHYLHDESTGKTIELGMLSNFGSTEYEVGVYDAPDPNRSKYGLRMQQISIVGSPGPDPQKMQFDGQCYFIRSAYRTDWDRVRTPWIDNRSGKRICFYVLTPNGSRVPTE